jgi:CheY-like chemotaxis protein
MSKRILVVEDQPDNRQIIRDMLTPTDYEVTEAENGEEVLAAIAKQRQDLILMDVQLRRDLGYLVSRLHKTRGETQARLIEVLSKNKE